jgi:hypothetical protein
MHLQGTMPGTSIMSADRRTQAALTLANDDNSRHGPDKIEPWHEATATAFNQSILKSINQSINQSINLEINQPVNQSVNQSINQSIY